MSYRIQPQACWQRALSPDHSAPKADAPLRLIEWCVLWLIHADPRLATRRHRPRLRALVMQLDPSFHHRRIGDALGRLRDLHAAGMVTTRGFDGGMMVPTDAWCEVAFQATHRAFGRHDAIEETMQARRDRFYRIVQLRTSGEQGGLDWLNESSPPPIERAVEPRPSDHKSLFDDTEP
ncbi:hypothetical protein [Luteibacter sahnii]|uniref:hypothetical protein n=1 Tax=Luteibacter sahnii TaxID=3021977 RepID=UPI002A6A73BE|nr:hypothetical protein [Luteibacter sp. PPL193]MDY1548032.1 hypothetical protein [Luteibacter sp. PPL193]